MIDFENGVDPHFNFTSVASRIAGSLVLPLTVDRQRLSAQRFQRVFTAMEMLADFLASAASIFLASACYLSLDIGRHIRYTDRSLATMAVAMGALCVVLFGLESAYRGGASLMRIRETERTLRVSCTAFALFLPLTWIAGQSYSRGLLLLVLPILPVLLLLEKTLLYKLTALMYSRGYGMRKVVIYGAKSTGRRLFSALLHDRKLGYYPVAMVDHDPKLEGLSIFELGYNRRRFVQVTREEITAEYLRSVGCDCLFLAIPGLRPEEVRSLCQSAEDAGAEVAFLPGSDHSETNARDFVDLDGLSLIFANRSQESWLYTSSKYALDIACAVVLLVFLSPLLLLIAVLIRLDSPGPVFFRQTRIGTHSQSFEIFKFRTMNIDAPKYEASPVEGDDRRITRLGKLLRRSSFDELPQLINVLLGDMSLVGPRPEMPFLVEQYDAVQRGRLSVKPGITGLWQISADRAFHIHENPEYDYYYLRHRGFFLDLAILIHTALFAMRGV